jgi:hypothetical protein
MYFACRLQCHCETIIWPVILIFNYFKHRNEKQYISNHLLNEQLKTNVAI